MPRPFELIGAGIANINALLGGLGNLGEGRVAGKAPPAPAWTRVTM